MSTGVPKIMVVEMKLSTSPFSRSLKGIATLSDDSGAERAGIVLGLENYLTAEANLKIIKAARSPAVQVYYDVYNSHVSRGHDPVREIKLLGRERICQVHLKEGGQRLGASGKIDWPAVAAALKEVGYAGWLVLETSSPSGNVANDTRANLEYARKTFAAIAG